MGLGLLLVSLISAAPGPRERILVLDTAPATPGLSERLVEKTSELLRSQLAGKAAVVSAAEMEQLRQGASGAQAPDLSQARTALEQGKDLYLNLEFAKAAERLQVAATAFEAALPVTADFVPLSQALVYLGASALSAGQEKASRAAFNQLLRLRPGYELDPKQWAPEVQEAFGKAREEQAKQPTASITVSSAPPLARVIIDGQPRGETPLTLDRIPLGRHTVQVEFSGYRPFQTAIELTAQGFKREVRLEKSQAGDEIRFLEAGARDAGPKRSLVEHAQALASAAGVSAVVVSALYKLDERYVLAAASVGVSGTVAVAWTTIDTDFLKASVAIEGLAKAVREAPVAPAFVEVGVGAPSVLPDFDERLLGFAMPSAAVAKPVAAVVEGTPFYKKWWFWGGIVAVGAAGTAGYLLTRPPQIIQQPDTVNVTINVTQ